MVFTEKFDALIVGSGINSLVCAALLARSGKSVLVLERSDVFGGCIRTEALTLPGFLHDTLATAFPLFLSGPAYAELGPALHQAGLEFCSSETPTGVLLPDGTHAVLSKNRAANVVAFDSLSAGDGAAFVQAMSDVQANEKVIFPLLGDELWRASTVLRLGAQVLRRGMHPMSAFAGEAMTASRHWLDGGFQGHQLQALMAPWALHAGLGPESPMSALMTKVIMSMLEAFGLPQIRGGGARLIEALVTVIEDAGGALERDADVDRVLVRDGRAVGVCVEGGREIHARDVICNVTPTQLYGRLLEPDSVSQEVQRQSKAYRYGKGNMQIHLALSRPLAWPAEALSKVTYVHLTGGVDAVSRAVNEAERGLLPAAPTLCIAQPSIMDPSRAPAGQAVLWIQLPECPRSVKGDALGRLDIPADGRWTPALREAYADRVIDQITAQVPAIASTILSRRVLSPADLNDLNVNLVGGDPYGGSCEMDQSMLWRPLRATRNHSTPVAHLWHIGASTHPGPGTSGSSGLHVARLLGARRHVRPDISPV